MENNYAKKREKQEALADKKLAIKVEKFDNVAKAPTVVQDTKLKRNATELRRYEVESLPFDNILIGAFHEITKELDAGNGYVMYDDLMAKLSGNAIFYQELADRTSNTAKLLLSDEFKHPAADGAIDVDMLDSIALLHCAEHKDDSPKILYTVLQRGGVGQQSWIAAGDKDTEPCFSRMARLASVIIFKQYKA